MLSQMERKYICVYIAGIDMYVITKVGGDCQNKRKGFKVNKWGERLIECIQYDFCNIFGQKRGTWKREDLGRQWEIKTNKNKV